jgi:hypothetical protein
VGNGATIDAVQLTMGRGTIKINKIEFTVATEDIADPIYMNFNATLTDRDGDQDASAFAVDIETDPNPLVAPDLTYTDHEVRTSQTDDQPDVFNFYMTGSETSWVVNGFDTGIDTLALHGVTAGNVSINATGGDDIITVDVGGTDKTITLVNGPEMVVETDFLFV